MNNNKAIHGAYTTARQQYADLGVDTDAALVRLQSIPISIQCWQGDDVAGFEQPDARLDGGGIQATGNYLGKARNIDQLRADFEKVLSLLPGRHRINLHASYLDNGGTFVDRDQIEVGHYQSWIDWAKSHQVGIDFNPTYFSHPRAADGFTLSHPDRAIRDFWIEHGKRCRQIGAQIGTQLGSPVVTNVWVPDGYKDIPADRYGPRRRLVESLDAIFSEPIDPQANRDAVESKLFGIGAESYAVGSHEFYLGYAISRGTMVCFDAGHYHPTEVISDKISAALNFLDGLLLHVSRPVRWDSDHVVILDDELKAITAEIVRNDFLDRVSIGLDFFDASINRVAAWVLGTRSMIKALLIALLEPTEKLFTLEREGDYTGRLAMLEQLKTMPFGTVWEYYCQSQGVPGEGVWLQFVREYEEAVLSLRV